MLLAGFIVAAGQLSMTFAYRHLEVSIGASMQLLLPIATGFGAWSSPLAKPWLNGTPRRNPHSGLHLDDSSSRFQIHCKNATNPTDKPMTTTEKTKQYVLETYGRFPLTVARGEGTKCGTSAVVSILIFVQASPPARWDIAIPP
jgi:hypothetical protein